MDDRRTHTAGRLLELAALLGLVASAGTALSRVFRYEDATAPIIMVVFASVAIAAATARLKGILALPLSAYLLTWLVAWRTVPRSLAGGWLAGQDTAAALLDALRTALSDARVTIAPVVSTRPFLAAALLATVITTLLAHALLVRAHRPLLALIPPLIPVAFADLSLGWRAAPGATIGLAASALAMILAEGVGRILSYGRVEPPMRLRDALAATTRGARLPIAIVTVLAVAAPGLLPSSGSAPLLDLSGPLAGVTRLQPFVSIRAQLEQDDRRILFRVRTDDGKAAYWRLFSLDRFDGSEWTASPAELSEPVSGEADLPFADATSGSRLDQNVEFLTDGVGGSWLPLAYPATSVSANGDIRFDDRSGTVLIEPAPEAGDRYEVRSVPLSPSPEELDAVRFLPAEAYGELTSLPANGRRALARIAREWTTGAETPYRQVLAIQRGFLDGSFSYSLDVPEDDGTDTLLRFLQETRVGFCQQFATAMAAMVRALGYPARVAVGFRQGERRGDTYTVTNLDAHAWVEVLFPGIGWLAFEPTPGRPNPVGVSGSYLRPTGADVGGTDSGEGATADGGGSTDRPEGATCTLPDGTILPARLCRDGGEAAPVDGGETAPGETPAWPPGRSTIAWALLVGLAVIASLPVLRRALRRRRVARATDTRGRTLAAFSEFEGGASELGLRREDAETLAEYAERIALERPDLDAELRALVSFAEAAAYGGASPDDEAAARAVTTARAAAERLRQGTPWRRRMIGAYRIGG